MSFYSELAVVAAQLLAEFGQTVTIRRTTGKVASPVTGAVTTAGTVQDLTTKGVLRKYPDAVIDGTRMTTSDRELVLADTVQPLLTDKILIQGEYWTVQRVETVNPAGTAMVYKVQVRT